MHACVYVHVPDLASSFKASIVEELALTPLTNIGIIIIISTVILLLLLLLPPPASSSASPLSPSSFFVFVSLQKGIIYIQERQMVALINTE